MVIRFVTTVDVHPTGVVIPEWPSEFKPPANREEFARLVGERDWATFKRKTRAGKRGVVRWTGVVEHLQFCGIGWNLRGQGTRLGVRDENPKDA